MSKKRSYEERMSEFEISLVNQPIDYVVEPLTAIDWAKRRWHGQASVIEGKEGAIYENRTTQ